MAAPWATALLAVQKIDLRIRELQTRLTLLPAERKKLLARHHELAAGLETARTRIRQLELEVKKHESAIEALNAANIRLQQQSALVKKNHEYQAMLAEIDDNAKKIGDQETAVLNLFDQIQAAETELRRQTAEATAENRLLKAEFNEFAELETEIKKEITGQESLRAEAVSQTGDKIMEQYAQLLKDPRSVPLVPVEDGNCGNCFLKLTPQTLTQARNGLLVHCDHCNHLVYIKDL